MITTLTKIKMNFSFLYCSDIEIKLNPQIKQLEIEIYFYNFDITKTHKFNKMKNQVSQNAMLFFSF